MNCIAVATRVFLSICLAALATTVFPAWAVPADAEAASQPASGVATSVKDSPTKVPTTTGTAHDIVATGAAPCASGQCESTSAARTYVGWGALAIVLALFVAVIIWTTRGLSQNINDNKWSLARAMSEEVQFTSTTGNPAVTTSETKLISSSSRLIAYVGLLLIGSGYAGLMFVMIYDYATCAKIPDLTNASDFLKTGLVLFAPYAVNQAKAAISSLGKS